MNARRLLFAAAALDVIGQLGLLVVLMSQSRLLSLPISGNEISLPLGWLLFCVFLYLALGWLFGSYSLLRRRRISIQLLLQRVVITTLVTVFAITFVRWLLNPEDNLWLLHRRVQFLWLTGVSFWSLCIRIALRHGLAFPETQSLILLGIDSEAKDIQRSWRKVPYCQRLVRLSDSQFMKWLQSSPDNSLITVGQKWSSLQKHSDLLDRIDKLDPRKIQLISPLRLFERQQERLPPFLLCDGWMTYEELPWAATFSLQTQIKRSADLILASILLIISSPLLLIAVVWIYIDDPGPVFYKQQRSGWMSNPFTVYKLRTMVVQPKDAAVSWTQLKDCRVTRAGHYLRKFRVDELPQLINVLKGDMSLIGPRPERPELDKILERKIQHYRMRYWMRPGLSGWAQVSAPYAGTVEDSDLKLSYDLYYLKRFNIWLDLLILFRTIKTILKASGR